VADVTSRSDISEDLSYLAAACRFSPLEKFLAYPFEKHRRRDVLFRGRNLDTLDNLRMTAIWLVSPAIQGAQDQSFQLTSESNLSAAAVDSQQSVARDALATLFKSSEFAKANNVWSCQELRPVSHQYAPLLELLPALVGGRGLRLVHRDVTVAEAIKHGEHSIL
jgi:hypothetical protein